MECVLSGIRFLVLHILDILSGHAWLSFYHSYDYIHQYLAFVAGWTSCILGCYVSNEVIVSNIHRLSDDVQTSTTLFQNCLDNALDRCTCWIILYVDANAQQSSVWMVVLNISLYGCQCWTVLYVNVNANSALYGCTCEHCSMWMPILNNVLWRSQCRRMLCIGENAGQWLKKMIMEFGRMIFLDDWWDSQKPKNVNEKILQLEIYLNHLPKPWRKQT